MFQVIFSVRFSPYVSLYKWTPTFRSTTQILGTNLIITLEKKIAKKNRKDLGNRLRETRRMSHVSCWLNKYFKVFCKNNFWKNHHHFWSIFFQFPAKSMTPPKSEFRPSHRHKKKIMCQNIIFLWYMMRKYV